MIHGLMWLAMLAAGLQSHAAWWDDAYVEPTGATVPRAVTNVATPSLSGNALQLAYLGDGTSNGNFLAHTDPAVPTTAARFDLSLDFQYDSSHFQALEFATNKWTAAGARYEWALQYCNVAPNDGDQFVVPGWRIWTGARWSALHIAGKLTPGIWHHLDIDGTTTGATSRYLSFTVDGVRHPLNFSYPVAGGSTADDVSVAVQLDGDAAADRFDVVLDNVSLTSWQH